jgi:hypothetical protein
MEPCSKSGLFDALEEPMEPCSKSGLFDALEEPKELVESIEYFLFSDDAS